MAVSGKGGLFRLSSSALMSPIVAGWVVDMLLEIQLCNVVVAQVLANSARRLETGIVAFFGG